MRSHMSIQGHLLSEGQGAELTTEQLLACVGAEVSHEVAPLHEALATMAALMWPLTAVRPLVVSHVGAVHCGVAT